jgi:hypothetical protein
MDWAPSFHPGIDQKCGAAVRNAATLLESLGHKVEHNHPVVLDDDRIGDPIGVLLIATSEALTAVEAERSSGPQSWPTTSIHGLGS